MFQLSQIFWSTPSPGTATDATISKDRATRPLQHAWMPRLCLETSETSRDFTRKMMINQYQPSNRRVHPNPPWPQGFTKCNSQISCPQSKPKAPGGRAHHTLSAHDFGCAVSPNGLSPKWQAPRIQRVFHYPNENAHKSGINCQ